MNRWKIPNDGFFRYSYSQCGEDAWLQSVLLEPSGHYVDVGAHHPYRYSNTAALYRMGWRGLNIEPNPDGVRALRNSRPEDITVCVGVSDAANHLTYCSFSDPAVNGFYEREGEPGWIYQKYRLLKKTEVRCEPLSESMSHHWPKEWRLDYLNVDVEGRDLQVLKSLDWQRHVPRVITAEDGDVRQLWEAKDRPATTLLHEHGYAAVAKMGPTICYELQKRDNDGGK